MKKIIGFTIFKVFLTALFISLAFALQAEANFSHADAFALIRRIPPGEPMTDALEFLGAHVSEKTVDAKEGIKVRKWGTSTDKWTFEVLHDGSMVRAARIKWITSSRSEQQRIFGQLTGEGRRFFGKGAKYNGRTEAKWTDFGDKWIVLIKQEPGPADGVTFLSGIRDADMDSEKYGF